MSPEAEPRLDAEQRILDAAIEVASEVGLRRLSVGDVAMRAGMSRPTLYKRFPTRDDLILRTILREASVILDSVREAGDAADTPHGAIRSSVETALDALSEHPLLNRLIATEPETLIPFLVSPSTSLNGFIGVQVAELLDRYLPDLEPATRDSMADVVSRLFLSYAVDPSPKSAVSVADLLTDVALSAI